MTIRKQLYFDNIIAVNTWIDLNRGFVQVLKVDNVLEDWAYPTSARLKRPRILVRYIDFREEAFIPPGPPVTRPSSGQL